LRIIANDKFEGANHYTKDGLGLLTVEAYQNSLKKPEVDMVFLA
jgi:hypothetical protein